MVVSLYNDSRLTLCYTVWPEADFSIIDAAGHSAKESGIEDALVAATDKYATLAL